MVIYIISFLVFAAPVFLAIFLTSKVSGTAKMIGTGAVILIVLIVPTLLILLQQT